MFKNQNISIGTWVTLNHFSVVEIMAEAGFDWICIDLEHSVIDYYETQKLISTIEAKKCTPFVRVGENNSLIIKRVLDAGAMGIIVPSINSKKEAIQAVENVKYPPLGKRGVGLARAQGYGFNFKDYSKNINQTTKVVIQIEHIDAINELEKILSTKGVDASIIGPYDLSGSMGMPGDYNHPEVITALKKYEKISKKLGVPYGYHVIEPDYRLVLKKLKSGYSFIAFSLDTLFLGTLCRREMRSLKEALV